MQGPATADDVAPNTGTMQSGGTTGADRWANADLVPRSLDDIHMPRDAGAYADGLLAIMERIPDRWGRWISCDAGWYPLLIELDTELAALCPDYVVHQAKSKFGGLRYYVALPDGPAGSEPACCVAWESEPAPGSAGSQEEWQAYLAKRQAHVESPEHREATHEATELKRSLEEVITRYEARSVVTCETCGAPGQMLVAHHWWATACPEHRLPGAQAAT